MSFSISALRREFHVRQWSTILRENPYIAVVQLTGGRAWGRTNMKARVLGEHVGRDVGARFAVPKVVRAAAEQTKFKGIAELFRSAPSAVVYGTDVEAVAAVVANARKILDGAILVGGRFGDALVTPKTWEKVLESDGELAEWTRFVQVLAAPPAFLRVLDGNAAGLVQSVDAGAGAAKLVRVLDRHAEAGASEA